jgi:hypothetical protein
VTDVTTIPAGEVRAQVERILDSPGFIDSGLKLLVDHALTGSAHSVRDTATLRTRLEQYYGDAGKDDPIVIEIPKGASVPVFRRNDAPVGYQPSPGRKLFMMGLCLVALIIVWAFYFIASKQSP